VRRRQRLETKEFDLWGGRTALLLQSMTFSAWNANPATDDVTWRFARPRMYQIERPGDSDASPQRVPRCVAGDKVPFVRKEWTLGWVAVCEEHSLVLNTSCSHC
jgi:hypothetical protein